MIARRIGAAALLVALAYCGGELVVDQPPGHASDGGYVLDDGALAFPPGSKCLAYSASLQRLDNFACKDESGADCLSVAKSQLPADYPFLTTCTLEGDVPHCWFNSNLPARCGAFSVQSSVQLLCHLGTDGDAFCSSYFTQFVQGGGVAIAKCVPACAATATDDGVCLALPCGTTSTDTAMCNGQPCMPLDCNQLDLCVTRNGQSKCEPPCIAP